MSERMGLDETKAMLRRAQDGEARLLADMAAKDAQIKALADALEAYRAECKFMRGSIAEAQAQAALHLCGRL